MSTIVTCVNHPERNAVEHCEVCGVPLCAYCLYYTDDGQRLCQNHARQAQATGATVHAPGTYAEGIIPSQVTAGRAEPARDAQYTGDTADLLALIGLIIGIISIMLCTPFGLCLIGPVGVLISIFALIGAKNSRDPMRTRTMASIGMTLSGVWLLVILACIMALYANTLPFFHLTSVPMQGQFQVTVIAPLQQPPPQNTPIQQPVPQDTSTP